MKIFLFLPRFKSLFSFLIIIAPFVGQSQCTHTLNMYDSYGDGWNGGELNINVNNVSIGTFTITSGSSGSATFSASDGDDIDVAWSATGSWASERSWTIVDGYGAGTQIGSGNGSSPVNNLVGNCSPPPTNIIPASGNSTHTDCSGSVYEVGGAGSNYSNNLDGSLTIYPNTVGAFVNINGTSTTESGYDYFYVYDGESASATLLATITGTSQAVNYTSTHVSGALTVRLTSDGSVTYSGIDIAITCIYPCDAPSGLTSSSITETDATISWSAPASPPSDGYDYYYSTSSATPASSVTPSGSVGAGVLTDNLSGLTAGFTYYYWVRSNCGSGTLSDWSASNNFTTTAAAPTVTSFTPSGGCAGIAEVVITGTNLGGTSAVTIGATAVTSFTVDNATQITAIVGAGSDGVVEVTNSGGSASSASSFTFTAGSATITSDPVATLDIAAGNVDVISIVATGASSYQWEYSEDNALWSNVVDGTPANVTYAGATTANLTIQPNTSVAGATGYYRCIAQCGDVTSSSAAVTYVQYCDQTGGTDSGVVGVTFGTIDNTTSNPYNVPYSDYYNDFDEQFLRDTDYDLNVYINTGGNYTNYQTVWIDWDGSGTFDNDEEYDLGVATNVTNGLSSLCPLTITVPSDAIEGNIRMRILSVYGAPGLACTSFTWGEVEDYKLVVRFPNYWAGTTGTDWHTAANWAANELPTTLSIVEIPTSAINPTEVSQHVTIASLKIDPGMEVTCSGGALNVLGVLQSAGMLNIGKSTVNVDGDFSGAAGTIMMTDDDGNLELGSTATSLGALNTDMGTVTYNGGTQNVLDGAYCNLSIENPGVKTALGPLDIDGDLTTGATTGSRLDMGTNQLNLAGDLNIGAQNGLDLTESTSVIVFDGATEQNITHAGNATSTGGATDTEDFESGMSWTANDSPSTWEFEEGDVVSSGTGPAAANGGLIYGHFDATGGVTGQTADISKTFDFGSYNSPQISYYYHMFGPNMGSLAVEINTGSGWTSLWSVSGQQNSTDASAWNLNAIDLAAYAGESSVTIRFLATRGNGYQSDVALDDIVVSDLVGAITGDFEFTNLTVNNTGSNVELQSDVRMDGALTLTLGDLDASKQTITLTTNGTASAGSNTSHVIGTMIKNTNSVTGFTFPLGDGTYYKAISITPTAASATVWTAEYFNTEYANTTLDPANFGDIDHISAYEYWDLDRSGSANAIVGLPWVPQNSVSVYADLRLAHFDGTDWDMISATPVGTNALGVVTSGSAVTSFSPFTLASSSSSNALPIELVSFSGEKKDNRNILNWTTASEINNAYFTVEKSYNGIDFEWVGTQEGTSPSTQIINYSLPDYNVLETLNYYRLKQTDFDGKFEYSNTISIDNRVDNSFKEIIGKTNLIGQEVDDNYNGIVIVRYKDGTSQKFYQFK